MIPTIHAAAEKSARAGLSPVDLLESAWSASTATKPASGPGSWSIATEPWPSAERGPRNRSEAGWRGPLHGIPLGIKDIFDVFDWPTACGSRLWTEQHRPPAMPRWSRRLRQAGAVFLGKTVTTQYASFDPPPTRNPWNLDADPRRLQQRLGGGRGLRHVPGGAGVADRRLDHPARVLLRRRRLKPTYGRGQHRRRDAAGAVDGPSGPDGRDCVRDLAILLAQSPARAGRLAPDRRRTID